MYEKRSGDLQYIKTAVARELRPRCIAAVLRLVRWY